MLLITLRAILEAWLSSATCATSLMILPSTSGTNNIIQSTTFGHCRKDSQVSSYCGSTSADQTLRSLQQALPNNGTLFQTNMADGVFTDRLGHHLVDHWSYFAKLDCLYSSNRFLTNSYRMDLTFRSSQSWHQTQHIWPHLCLLPRRSITLMVEPQTQHASHVHQHLKIWRRHPTPIQGLSISFSVPEMACRLVDPRHHEEKLCTWFIMQIDFGLIVLHYALIAIFRVNLMYVALGLLIAGFYSAFVLIGNH